MCDQIPASLKTAHSMHRFAASARGAQNRNGTNGATTTEPQHQNLPLPPSSEPSEDADTSIKEGKLALFETVKNPITLADVIAKFQEMYPNEPFDFVGNLDSGLVVYSTATDQALHVITVPSSAFIPSAYHYLGDGKIDAVTFGGVAGQRHVDTSILEPMDDTARTKLQQIVQRMMDPSADLMQLYQADQTKIERRDFDGLNLNGALQMGFEREFWVIHPNTGELANIRDEELIVGLVEIDDGLYATPMQSAVGMARLQRELEERYPGLLLVNSSVPPSGTVQKTEVNSYNEPDAALNLGPYIAIIERGNFRRYQPSTPDSRQVRDQQARHHGYTDADDMICQHGDCRTWTTAAEQINQGVANFFDTDKQRFEVPFEMALNSSNISLSELGAIARILTMSSPYITDLAPTLDGHHVRDLREVTRGDLGTAAPHNQPINDMAHYLDIVKSTMTAGIDGSDRLSRAVVAHTNVDGSYTATAHGDGRWRFEDTGKMSGRVEYTGSGSTSILPKNRAMAILQMLQAIATIATSKGQDVFDYIQAQYGWSKAEIVGDADATVAEFNHQGPGSKRSQALFDRLTDILERTHIPALDKIKAIALAAMRDVREEGNLQDFAHGKGTFGGAMITLAKLGYTGLQAAKVMDAFLRQESDFILKNPHLVEDYLLGEVGFDFTMPIDI